jgi:hypothetical protein
VTRGPERAARLLAGVYSKKRGDRGVSATTVSGKPRVVLTSGVNVIQVVTLRIKGIARAVYMINNPDNLSPWSLAEVE